MKTTAEKIAVMEQWGKKTIQSTWSDPVDEREWWDVNIEPVWNWEWFNYRVKPEQRRFWVMEIVTCWKDGQETSVRSRFNSREAADESYRHFRTNSSYRYSIFEVVEAEK